MVKEDRGAVIVGFHTARADFQKQAETRLARMGLSLDELEAKAKIGHAVTKERMNEAIANLQKRTEAMRKELQEIKTATPERWETLKTHLNTSLEELESGFEVSFSRFMNEWTRSGCKRLTFSCKESAHDDCFRSRVVHNQENRNENVGA
jgi:hypothetical protein